MNNQQAFDRICELICRDCGVERSNLARETTLASIPGLDMLALIEISAVLFRKTIIIDSTNECTIGDVADQLAG